MEIVITNMIGRIKSWHLLPSIEDYKNGIQSKFRLKIW